MRIRGLILAVWLALILHPSLDDVQPVSRLSRDVLCAQSWWAEAAPTDHRHAGEPDPFIESRGPVRLICTPGPVSRGRVLLRDTPGKSLKIHEEYRVLLI
jgi:hypothetical protein